MKADRLRPFSACFLFLFLAACAGNPVQQKTGEDREAIYTPVSFQDLPGWQNDPLKDVQSALLKSCSVFQKRGSGATVAPTALAGTVNDWLPACEAITRMTNIRAAIESNFTPYRVTTPVKQNGLFTGYYEKQLRGSLTKNAVYNVPLYKRPPELVMVDLGLFRPAMKGERIAGKVVDGNLKPYASRADIDNGALSGRGLELLWVNDADAAFFLAVQGSGRVTLDNGKVIRVGYDGQNGHIYYAIGKELIARGELTPENVSLQTIDAWLKAHPTQAAALRQKNPSYVFFKTIEGGEGAIGAQGVALTPTRSLAVDPRFIPYGAPVWLDAQHPTQADTHIQRLVIAQDTGGAIRGPIRGDFFWGIGEAAEAAAGVMKSQGTMWVLLPKTLQGARRVTLP
jgi:membrane-bound lytic murein transglycosylase A